MKRLIPYLLAATPLLASAQSQRLVILEHFTQASCPPCAFYNPTVMTNYLAESDKMIMIKYHTSWPGVDPMNAENATDVQSRVTYYSVTGVPTSVIDGHKPGATGHPTEWNTDTIENHFAVPAQYDMRVSHQYLLHGAGHDSVSVSVMVRKTGNTGTSAQKLMIGVIEREVTFPSPPGTNGETEFPFVMKKLLPSATGQALPTLAIGDSIAYSFKWKLANVYDYNQLAVVGFIQDGNKHIHQSAYSQPRPLFDAFSFTGLPKGFVSGTTGQYDFTASVKTKAATPTTYTVLPPATQLAGTQTVLLDGSGNAVDSLLVTLDSTTTASVPVRITVTAGDNLHGAITVRVRPGSGSSFDGLAKVGSVPMYSKAPLAVINLEGASSVTLNSITTGRSAYVITPAEYTLAPPAIFSGNNYGKIVLLTGNQYANLMSSEAVDTATAFLQNNGDMLVMGVDFSYSAFQGGADYMQPLITDYLGANYVSDNPGGGTTTAADRAIASSDTIGYQVPAIALAANSYDQLEVAGDGVECFHYQTGDQSAGIYTHVGGRHTMYASFPLSSVAAAARTKLISNTMLFFDDAFVTDAKGKINLMPMQVAPNPAIGSVNFTNLSAGDVIRLTDLTGRVVAEGTATGSTLGLPMEGRSAGLYMASQVRSGAVISTAQVSLTR